MNKIILTIITLSLVYSQILCIRYKTLSSIKSRDYIDIRLKKLNKSLLFVPNLSKVLTFAEILTKQVFG